MNINNSVINTFQGKVPFMGSEKEEKRNFSSEEVKDTVTFSQKGLKAMSEQDNILDAIKEGEAYIEAIASQNRGSREARLAGIAMKITEESDCFLATLSDKEIFNNLQNIPEIGTGNLNRLAVLFEPLEAVYRSTLETLASGAGGALSLIAAQTALKAMESLEKGANPLAPALAAEPFMIGIAEHDRENKKMGDIADLLQEELSPNLTYPSNAAYKIALEAMAKGCSEPSNRILARIGNGIINSIPGQEKDIAPLAKCVLEKMADDNNPLVNKVAEIILDEIESLENDMKEEDKKEKSKEAMLSLYRAGFNSLGEINAGSEYEPMTLDGVAKTGITILDSLNTIEPHLPSETIAEIGKTYINFITENVKNQTCEVIKETRIRCDDEETKNIARSALYRSTLEALINDEDKPLNINTYLDIGLSAMKSLDGGKHTNSQVAIGRAFLEFLADGYPSGLPTDVASVLDLPPETENIAVKYGEALNKLKEG
ncbi:MAG: hypothetical protein BWY64_03181 [bacterium ADurb.Bin363]|nr:MAG: hypothetical protein BWY64_03181 [bacterium ADurb.Bin363]